MLPAVAVWVATLPVPVLAHQISDVFRSPLPLGVYLLGAAIAVGWLPGAMIWLIQLAAVVGGLVVLVDPWLRGRPPLPPLPPEGSLPTGMPIAG